jgi:hypothetical protein
LGATGRDESFGERVAQLRIETLDSRDASAGDAPDRRHAGHARLVIDEDGAAPALPLRRAAVLGGDDTEALTQDREQRFARNDRHVDGYVVARERDAIPSCAHDRAG